MTEPPIRPPQGLADPELLARLSELKDVELPDPASFWPPAPGWWAVMLLLLVTLFLIVRLYRARRPKHEARREALDALEDARARWEADGDAVAYASAADQLIRRLAIHRLGRHAVARLTGEAFSEAIRHLSSGSLSESTTRLLRESRYQPHVELDPDRIHQEIEAWIEALREPDRA
jgi:hypothetical protein